MKTRNGHASSPDAVVALSTTWVLVGALGLVAADKYSSWVPSSCQLDTVDLDIDTVAGAASVEAMLTHDTGGLHVIAGPTSAGTLWSGAGVPAGRSGTSFTLLGRGFTCLQATSAPFAAPVPQGQGVVYLWLRLDAGTANLSAMGARLNWRDPTSG